MRQGGRKTFIIRRTRVDDYGKMSGLAGQLGYPSSEKQIRLRMERMTDDDHAVFVAEEPGGKLAGWIGLYIFRSVELDPCAFISGLVVDEAFRSHGIGHVLLSAGEDWARDRGCLVICVSSNVTRSRAHGFYVENGYQNRKTQYNFLKNLTASPPSSRP